MMHEKAMGCDELMEERGVGESGGVGEETAKVGTSVNDYCTHVKLMR